MSISKKNFGVNRKVVWAAHKSWAAISKILSVLKNKIKKKNEKEKLFKQCLMTSVYFIRKYHSPDFMIMPIYNKFSTIKGIL